MTKLTRRRFLGAISALLVAPLAKRASAAIALPSPVADSPPSAELCDKVTLMATTTAAAPSPGSAKMYFGEEILNSAKEAELLGNALSPFSSLLRGLPVVSSPLLGPNEMLFLSTPPCSLRWQRERVKTKDCFVGFDPALIVHDELKEFSGLDEPFYLSLQPQHRKVKDPLTVEQVKEMRENLWGKWNETK